MCSLQSKCCRCSAGSLKMQQMEPPVRNERAQRCKTLHGVHAPTKQVQGIYTINYTVIHHARRRHRLGTAAALMHCFFAFTLSPTLFASLFARFSLPYLLSALGIAPYLLSSLLWLCNMVSCAIPLHFRESSRTDTSLHCTDT